MPTILRLRRVHEGESRLLANFFISNLVAAFGILSGVGLDTVLQGCFILTAQSAGRTIVSGKSPCFNNG